MGKYDKRSIFRKVSKSPRFQKRALEKAQQKFNAHKRQLLSEFESHSVTQELKGGAEADNISGTLNGYGNLFSFIGFESMSDPAADLRALLNERTRLTSTIGSSGTARTKVKSHAGKIIVKYTVHYPSLDDIAAATPMPWEGGSWVINIERGISGFSSYLYQSFEGGYSRSGKGGQAKISGGGNQKIRSGSYVPTSYLSVILKKFKTKFSYF